jgi:uncharacterized protein (DUF1501 family)
MISTRRQFMIGCSSAIAALAGSRLVRVALADESTPPSIADQMLVVIFLRGGMDALHLLGPANDKDYIAARSAQLRIADAGEEAGLAVAGGPAGLDFRLHKNAAGLKELYDAKSLAFVHACGLTDGTRSHFEAMDLIERGVLAGPRQGIGTGWLTRYLQATSAASRPAMILAVSGNAAAANSLLGTPGAMSIPNPAEFKVNSSPRVHAALQAMYAGDAPLLAAGTEALAAVERVQGKVKRNNDGSPVPYVAENAAAYEESEIARSLKSVAQLIKMDLGLRVATVDLGGWDTHEYQPGPFPALVGQLSNALVAFYSDLSRYHGRLTVVVMSEFGRRLKANQSNGTDHGHGGAMMLLGGGVAGGRILGRWPGLATEQLDCGADLAVTTDYRAVVSELLTARYGLANPAAVFPGFAPAEPLGLFA